MLWTKNCHKTGFGILLLVFFAVFSSFFFLNTNASAISDISVTVSSGSYNQPVFSNCSGSCLTQYKYLIIESDDSFYGDPGYFYFLIPRANNNSNPARFYVGGLTYSFSSSSSVFSVNLLPFDSSFSNAFLFWGSNYTFSSAVTLTLSESYSSCPSVPSGSITLTENGSFDVTSYATAIVDVPPTIEQGDYHDDLISIQQAIYVCGAILLVLYFFYCIYRMIIKTTGGYL